jgi:hypothetical protein
MTMQIDHGSGATIKKAPEHPGATSSFKNTSRRTAKRLSPGLVGDRFRKAKRNYHCADTHRRCDGSTARSAIAHHGSGDSFGLVDAKARPSRGDGDLAIGADAHRAIAIKINRRARRRAGGQFIANRKPGANRDRNQPAGTGKQNRPRSQGNRGDDTGARIFYQVFAIAQRHRIATAGKQQQGHQGKRHNRLSSFRHVQTPKFQILKSIATARSLRLSPREHTIAAAQCPQRLVTRQTRYFNSSPLHTKLPSNNFKTVNAAPKMWPDTAATQDKTTHILNVLHSGRYPLGQRGFRHLHNCRLNCGEIASLVRAIAADLQSLNCRFSEMRGLVHKKFGAAVRIWPRVRGLPAFRRQSWR